jgi:hypothetical protein
VLTQEECDQFLADFDEALELPDEQRHYRLLDAQKAIEFDMNFLGATGLEEAI